MSFSQFTEQDSKIIAREWATLKEAAKKRCANAEEFRMVEKAFEFANEAHKNVRRRSGEPYIIHPIAVAGIVVGDIGLGYKSICAALLHDVVEDTRYTSEDIKALFGEKIASLVEGLTKIKTVLDNEDRDKRTVFEESVQAENFKRILLTLNDDVRVILIKLADRLHNCRTIEFMPEYKRDKILSETMYIFIPLAHRLGLYEIKSEMENIWLRYKEPDAYNEITSKINADVGAREKEINECVSRMSKAIGAAGFDFQIRKRIKTPYSTWHKMKAKDIPFEQVYDLYALRIVFTPMPPVMGKQISERDQCYHIFSIITGLYRYKPERVRDWVKHPKSNGYEALHCTLMSEHGLWIEVQIRTRRMDDIAEKGIAAHWAYKKDGYIGESDNEMDKWLTKIKEILVSPDVNALELLDIIHDDLTTTQIAIFTPKGEQKSVQKGSTALDFAYQIHTEIGNKAIAAKVNQKLVPLSQVLKTGDQVEIITSEDESPKPEWLSFLQTRSARNRVTEYFRNCRRDTVSAGRKLLSDRLSQLGTELSNEVMLRLLRNYGLTGNDAEEFLFRIGMGTIAQDRIEGLLKHRDRKGRQPSEGKAAAGGEDVASAAAATRKGERFVIGEGPRTYVFADCCNPIPGDAIVGVLSPDGVITVHKKSCPVADSMGTKHGDWLVVPDWGSNEGRKVTSFLTAIHLRGIDRVGLLNDITSCISKERGLNMRKINVNVEQGIFEGTIELYVDDKSTLSQLIARLRSIKGLTNVDRAEI